MFTIADPLEEKVLRQKSIAIEIVDAETKTLIQDLLDTMRNGDNPGRIGVGLAAPQIGVNKRVIVLEFNGENSENGRTINKIPTTVLVNPNIVKYSKEKETFDEGCFSVPDYYGPVERSKKIRVEALNQEGKSIKINASGYFAKVLQHEIDHLDGILFTDHVERKNLFKYVLNAEGKWSVEYCKY